MPEGVEYLHCIQAALDETGLRYQVLDTDGVTREQFQWPPMHTDFSGEWQPIEDGKSDALFTGSISRGHVVEFRLTGQTAPKLWAPEQTLFTAYSPEVIAPIWLGLRGLKQTLTLVVGRQPGRSPSYWFGPDLPADSDFDLHVALYPEMGPGGILYRKHGETAWTSFKAATATGIENVRWPSSWNLGHGQHGSGDRPFKGHGLTVNVCMQSA